MFDALFEEEVFEVMATEFMAQEGLKLFILFEEGVFEVSP